MTVQNHYSRKNLQENCIDLRCREGISMQNRWAATFICILNRQNLPKGCPVVLVWSGVKMHVQLLGSPPLCWVPNGHMRWTLLSALIPSPGLLQSVAQMTNCISSMWRRQVENRKVQDTLLGVAEKWQEFPKSDIQDGDEPFMMKCLNVSRSFWTFCFF